MIRRLVGGYLPAPILLITLASTAWGVAQLPWMQCIPFTTSGLLCLSASIALSAALIMLMTRWARIPVWLAVALTTPLIAIGTGTVWAVIWVAMCALAFLAVGQVILRCIGWSSCDRTVECLAAIGVGAVTYGALIELCASMPINTPPVYFSAVSLPIVARWRWVMCALRVLVSSEQKRVPASPWITCSEYLVGSLAVIYLVTAFFPEGMYDALVVHLAVPAEVASKGKWHFDHLSFSLAVTPKHANWLFSLGYMQGGEVGARLLNSGLIVGCGLVIYRLTAIGSRSKGHRNGMFAMALFLSTPITYTVGSSLFAEPAWTFYILISMMMLVTRRECADPSPVVAAMAVMLAGAVATKPQALVVSAAVLVIMSPLIWHFARKPTTRACLACAASLTIVASAPYVRALLLTGNPVFPFYNGLFRAEGFPPMNFVDGRWLMPVDWTFLYSMTFNSQQFIEGQPGAAGFQWLLLLVPASIGLVASRNRTGLTLLAAALLSWVAVFVFIRYLRYVFPSMAMFIPAIVLGLTSVTQIWDRLAGALVTMCIAANLLFLPAASRYGDFPVTAAFSRSKRDEYVSTHLHMRLAVDSVNAMNIERRPVVFFAEPFGAGLTGMPRYTNWYTPRLQAAIGPATTDRELLRLVQEEGAELVILDRRSVHAAVSEAVTRITEVTTRHGPVEVRRLRSALTEAAEPGPPP